MVNDLVFINVEGSDIVVVLGKKKNRERCSTRTFFYWNGRKVKKYSISTKLL